MSHQRHKRRKCPRCEGTHKTAEQYRRCDGGEPSDPAPPPPTSPSIRYDNDPLKGDHNAHTITRKYKLGWSPRKIAKHMGLPIDTVKDAIDRIYK